MTRAAKLRLVAWPAVAIAALMALRWARSLGEDHAPARLSMQMKFSERLLEPGHLPAATVIVGNYGGLPGRIPEPFLRHAVVHVGHDHDGMKVCSPKGVALWGTSTRVPPGGEVVYQIPRRMLSACVAGSGSGDYAVWVSYNMPPDPRRGDRPSLWERRYWQGQLAETSIFHVKTPEELHVEDVRRRRGPPTGLCAHLDHAVKRDQSIWVQEGDRRMPGPLTPALDPIAREVVLMDTTARERKAPELLRPQLRALVALLQEPHVGKRYWGVYLLGRLGGDEAARPLLDLLEREREVVVIEPLMQELVTMRSTEIVPAIISLLDCQIAPLQEFAWNWATSMPDERVADAMVDLWETGDRGQKSRTLAVLSRLKDRRGFTLALQDLKLGGAATIRATGSAADVGQVMEAFRRQTMDPWPRVEMIGLILEWSKGAPEAMKLAAQVFDQADESAKGEIATTILKAQLKPDKPPPLDSRRLYERCFDLDGWYGEQAPFARREVDRLLAPENRRYFQEAGFGRRNEVSGPFDVLSRVSAPAERVELWRKVLALFEGASPKSLAEMAQRHVHRQLALALLSLTSAKLPADPSAALRLLDEVAAICAQEPNLATELDKVLDGVRDRALRLQGADTSSPLPRLPGHFRLSTGMGGGDLVLEDGGRYRLTSYSDVHTGCPENNVTTGAYVVERGWVVLIPDRQRGYLDVAQSYLPVTWGGAVYLVQYPEDFCRAIEDVRVRAGKITEAQLAAVPDTCEVLRAYIGAYRETEPTSKPDECIPPPPSICGGR